MTRWRTPLVIGIALLGGALVGFFVSGGGGGADPRLAGDASEPVPLILPLTSGAPETEVIGIPFADPIAARTEPQVVSIEPAAAPVPEVAAEDRTVDLATITLPNGVETSLFELMLGPEPADDFRFIDPCAGDSPGNPPAEGCDGVSGTILGYTSPGPFRITRVTTASTPGLDPAYDLCRLHYGTPRPGEATIAIYSTQPGDFTITGWASWVARAPAGDGTATGTETLLRFGPVQSSTSTSQTTAWQAEMGSPRPNPGVVTCRLITGLGPSGSRLHIRIDGVSLLGATTHGEFDLTHTEAVGVPPTILTGQDGLVIRALIPVRADHTVSLTAFPSATATGSPGDQGIVNQQCAGDAPGIAPAVEITRFPIFILGLPALMGWDSAWTEFAVLDARLPGPGSYIVCASRKVNGRLTEWEGFSVATPSVPIVHLDIVAVNGAIPLTSLPGESNSSIEIYQLAAGSAGGRILNPVVCATNDLRPRRDACRFNRPTRAGATTVDVAINIGSRSSQDVLSLPDTGCSDTAWSCPTRTDSYRIPWLFEDGISVDIVLRQEPPPYPTSVRGASGSGSWVIQPTGNELSTGLGSVLPQGPPTLTASSVGPGSGEGPLLAVSLTASAAVHVTLTVEDVAAAGCEAPDRGTVHGPYAGGVSVTLNLRVACAGGRYSLRAEIEDAAGRRSVYSDVESGAVGPALVGVSSTRTTQARVQAVLGSLPGGRPVHVASASIVIDGRVVWSLPANDGRTTRRCTGVVPFGMTAPEVFQAAETFTVRIEVELVPFTNCATGAGRGTAVRRVQTAIIPGSLTRSLDPVGIGGGDPAPPTLSGLISRF